MPDSLLELSVDTARVSGEPTDFPVLIDVTHDALKGQSQVGFADGNGNALPGEVISFESSTGALRAEVRVPQLGGDTTIHITADSPTPIDTAAPTEAITVEAWADATGARAEALRSLVAKWRVNEKWGAFAGYDASQTDGLETTGFFGCVFDGRYIYFAPQYDSQDRHGKALRYDTHGDFKDPESWSAYDASTTDGLVCKGYYGAVFDGRYIVYVPRRDPDGFHSRALRYDTKGDFKDPGSWRAYDIGQPNSSQSAAFDGRYIYMNPGQYAEQRKDNTADDESPAVTGMSADQVLLASGNIIRFDTQGQFDDPASWTSHDAADTDGLNTRDFDGSCYDGRYVYFSPLAYAVCLRYDTHADFNTSASWQAYDCDARFGMKRNVGAIFDGKYVYYVPYGTCPVAVRFDTSRDFKEDDAWQAYELAKTPGVILGFDGAFFDGTYIYYIPYWNEQDVLHGTMLRYDTRRDFQSPDSWDCFDAAQTDGLRTAGFNGGASDGRFLYCAAWMKEKVFTGRIGGGGNMLRYDTTGDNATFDLRLCDLGHNGGLCAALPGPRFLINTDRGPRSIAANAAPPSTGMHHFAGVYDGQTISLYIDGQLVNSQPASGKLVANDIDIAIDQAAKAWHISPTARSADWIATRYQNLADPAGFCRAAE